MRAGRGKATIEAQRMRRIVDGGVALTARRGGTVPFTVCRACGMREDRWHADDCPAVVDTKYPGVSGTAREASSDASSGASTIATAATPSVTRHEVRTPHSEGGGDAVQTAPPPPVRPRPVKIDPTTIPSAMEQRAAGWGR